MAYNSRYPRRGYPISPATLSILLNRRVPPEFTNGIEIKYNQLDESAWLTFSEETCSILGRLLVKEVRLAKRRHPHVFMSQPIQPLPEGMTIDDLPLNARTINCLSHARGAQLVKEGFTNCTVLDLMSIRNFGIKTLIEFLTSLEYTIKTYKGLTSVSLRAEKETINPALIEEFHAKLHKLKNLPYSDQISLDDIRIRKILRFIHTNAGSLKDLTVFLEQRTFTTTEEMKHTIKVIDHLYKKAGNLGNLPLEKELPTIAKPLASERNATIYCSRYGWDGSGMKSLRDTGNDFGLTQERARQICKEIDKKLQSKPSFTPSLTKAISVVSELTPCLASDLSAKLKRLNISESSFEISGLVHALEKLTNKVYYIEAIDGSTDETVVPKELQGVTRLLLMHVRKVARHWGAVQTESLTTQFERETGIELNIDFALSVLQSRKDFRWLDKNNKYFWLQAHSNTRITNRIKKVMSVTDTISASDLGSCIQKDYVMKGYSPPEHILLEICRQLPGYTVENEIITSDQISNWEDILDKNESIMVRILKEKGPVMARHEFGKLCVDSGMKQSTISRYLSHSPVIIRYDYMVYGLPNADVSAETIKALVPDRNFN